MLEPTAAVSLSAVVRSAAVIEADRINLVVGPEGGIADEELAALEIDGAAIVRLGSEVLRTSTAGPAALAAIHALLGRW